MPEILGEELLSIGTELMVAAGSRLDLLAVDRKARLVVIELKRDSSGRDVEWQAIRYVSYCSNFVAEDVYATYAEYLQSDEDEAQLKIEEFINEELDVLNADQRVILVAQEFHSDVASAVLWLRDREIDIRCIRLQAFVDHDGGLFITPAVNDTDELTCQVCGKGCPLAQRGKRRAEAPRASAGSSIEDGGSLRL